MNKLFWLVFGLLLFCVSCGDSESAPSFCKEGQELRVNNLADFYTERFCVNEKGEQDGPYRLIRRLEFGNTELVAHGHFHDGEPDGLWTVVADKVPEGGLPVMHCWPIGEEEESD